MSMGVSTDGQLHFGIVFEEGTEFPWEMDEHEHDIEQWWRNINGYKDIFEPYTDEGEYAAGWSRNDPRFDEYFRHSREWLVANPVPVEVVNYCSDSCPMYLLAVPGVGHSNNRGYPVKIDPTQLVVTPEQSNVLVGFCKKYGIETSDDPAWYLTSYWG
jgi:hypothetical protein